MPSGIGATAALLRIEIYPATVGCIGNQVGVVSTPIKVSVYTPEMPQALELPPGTFIVHVIAYADSHGMIVSGEGCDSVTIHAGQTRCLELKVSVADGGMSDASCMMLQHTTGVGGSFYLDCDMTTSDVTLRRAEEACHAAFPTGTCAELLTCSGGSNGNALCNKASNCVCWTYMGLGAGHVHTSSGGGCSCATAADDSWN
jgi:hypothetical protein